jgi:cytochrome c oxidase assembly protein subunit 15
MNLKVFLEWFHRLDAFVVGVALLVQLGAAWFWRKELPRWFLPLSFLLVLLVVLQGGLGALTVLQLLPSAVVTAHLVLALTLVIVMSGLTQRLLHTGSKDAAAPRWWPFLGGISLAAVSGQCLLGGRMASSWAAQRCLQEGHSCQWLHWHRSAATPAAICVLLFVATALIAGGWARQQWPLLITATLLVSTQIGLGVLTLRLGLSQPAVTVGHQLVACLLVAVLAALTWRRPSAPDSPLTIARDSSTLEPCHG